MQCLAVCGITNPRAEADAALFGDFLGLPITLQHLNGDITGTYLSCFPLDEHFAVLGKQTPPTHNMKFGQTPDEKSLYNYSSMKYPIWSGLWYTDYTQKDLLGKVATWFREKAATVESGDVVNFFFKATEKGMVIWCLVEE